MLAMFRPGMGELLVVLVIILILFGATRLPKIGKALGEAIRGFKKSAGADKENDTVTSTKQKTDNK